MQLRGQGPAAARPCAATGHECLVDCRAEPRDPDTTRAAVADERHPVGAARPPVTGVAMRRGLSLSGTEHASLCAILRGFKRPRSRNSSTEGRVEGRGRSSFIGRARARGMGSPLYAVNEIAFHDPPLLCRLASSLRPFDIGALPGTLRQASTPEAPRLSWTIRVPNDPRPARTGRQPR